MYNIKNISKIFCFGIIVLSFVSCGASTKEVVKADNVNENMAAGNTADMENAMENDNSLNIVKAENIPIIEICPPMHFGPDYELPKEEPEGSGYNNPLKPVSIEDCDDTVITVKTNVPGVNVYLNNRYLGTSDIKVTNLIPRIYILGLEKEGYREESLFISILENKQQVFFVEMKKAVSD